MRHRDLTLLFRKRVQAGVLGFEVSAKALSRADVSAYVQCIFSVFDEL